MGTRKRVVEIRDQDKPLAEPLEDAPRFCRKCTAVIKHAGEFCSTCAQLLAGGTIDDGWNPIEENYMTSGHAPDDPDFPNK